MKLLTNLTGDTSNWLENPRVFARAIKIVLEANTLVNQMYLRTHRVPELYKSGVRYQEEPLNLAKVGAGPVVRIEEFALIPAVLERGWGDCDDLSPWLCAQLREQGEKANIRVVWREHPTTHRIVYHIVVRRQNGSVEDPNHRLGMPLSRIGARINQFAA